MSGDGNLTSPVYRRVQASEASAVAPFPRALIRLSGPPGSPLSLHGGAARSCWSPPPRPFQVRGAFLARTAEINNRAHSAHCTRLLQGIRLSKQKRPEGLRTHVRTKSVIFFFFFYMLFYFLLLKSRAPPMTDLLLSWSEAQSRRRWAAFAEVFFCILRRLVARC